MAKKYNPEDPDTWNDAQMNKYIIDKIQEIGVNMPWDKVVLSMILIYAHWKAFGAGTLPTKGDVMLGIVYALTIPPALQGGLVANSYATAALGALSIGLVIPQGMLDDPNAVPDIKQAAQDSASGVGFIENLKDMYDGISNWYDTLPGLIPPTGLD